MKIGLLPGAFKPPHKGHFTMVKDLLHGGVYKVGLCDAENSIEVGRNILSEGFSKNNFLPFLDKVVVFIGGRERDGFTVQHSLAVWNIYKKYLGENLEIQYKDFDPVRGAIEYAKNSPEQEFFAITGVRNSHDLKDLKRVKAYINCPNVKGLVYNSPLIREYRGQQIRQQLQQMKQPKKDLFPSEITDQDYRKLLQELLPTYKDKLLSTDSILQLIEEKTQAYENSSGTPIQPTTAMKSSDREKLVQLYNKIRNQLGEKFYNIQFNSDHITITLNNPGDPRNNPTGFDYTPYMSSILEYMILDSNYKITPLPGVKLRKDLVEGQDFFGKTAYYDPANREIVLYVEGRHPKDVMRSFCHEMVHHMQNLQGRLTEVDTTDTNSSESLLELEKEAYLQGNLIFRTWEDGVKSKYRINQT